MPAEREESLHAPPSPLSPVEAQHALASALTAETSEEPGAHIGAYKLLQQVGEGGFGTVWMAEQQEPIRRRVALKILKVGLDTREIVARFEAERQALALMDHPNIAQVFDAGATENGRPYFVMELVRGIPITRYCDENRLTTGARLRLFIAVCHGVQHAHHKGVIHRDLKPSNILVTLHDGVPVPKIIDFGIAKATSGARLTDKTLFTQFHAFVGTPAYTSPEQMEMSGLDVDARSDIYSLGVLLYELLAGRPPFDAEALVRSGLDAMRRTIREIDPPRPSQRVRTLSDADRTTAARQRGTDAAKLASLLHGDLDAIAMHCLEKDRTRRYETATALAADLERCLRDEPIVARPPGEWYRIGKFVRRHRIGVATVAAVVLSLCAGLIASSVLLVRERSARGREVEARRRAVAAEAAESHLRRQAEAAHAAEARRSSRTSALLAEQLLADGKTNDAIAHLVHAVRIDPGNRLVAPRLASLLASHRFLLPSGSPLHLGSPVRHSLFSADGKRIFVICADGTLAVIDNVHGGVLENKLPARPHGQGSIAIHGELVGVGCQDGTIRVINRDTIRVEREIRPSSPVQFAAGFEHGGPMMSLWLDDHSLAVADISTGLVVPLGVKATSAWLGDIAGDGRWAFVSLDPFCELQIWDTVTGRIHRTVAFDQPVPYWSEPFWELSPDGHYLATLCGGDPRSNLFFQVWKFPELEPAFEPERVENAINVAGNSLAISPDSRWLQIASPQGKQIFDLATGARIGAYVASAFAGTFSPDGERHVSAVTGGLQFFTTRSGEAVGPPMPHAGSVLSTTYSSNGAVLLTTSSDGFARVWDARTGSLLAEPTLQQFRDLHASIAPDGRTVLIGTAEGTVCRLRTGRGSARPLALPRSVPAMPAPFFPDPPARLLFLRGDRAVVLDVASGREVVGGFTYPEPIVGVDNGQRGIAVRSDLRFMVVLTFRGEWQAWELGPSGVERVVPLENAPHGVGWVRFSPTRDLIAIIPN